MPGCVMKDTELEKLQNCLQFDGPGIFVKDSRCPGAGRRVMKSPSFVARRSGSDAAGAGPAGSGSRGGDVESPRGPPQVESFAFGRKFACKAATSHRSAVLAQPPPYAPERKRDCGSGSTSWGRACPRRLPVLESASLI